MEKITIKIKPDGNVEFDLNGFVGTACNVTEAVEKALGLVDRSDKPEIFKNELQMNQFNEN